MRGLTQSLEIRTAHIHTERSGGDPYAGRTGFGFRDMITSALEHAASALPRVHRTGTTIGIDNDNEDGKGAAARRCLALLSGQAVGGRWDRDGMQVGSE